MNTFHTDKLIKALPDNHFLLSPLSPQNSSISAFPLILRWWPFFLFHWHERDNLLTCHELSTGLYMPAPLSRYGFPPVTTNEPFMLLTKAAGTCAPHPSSSWLGHGFFHQFPLSQPQFLPLHWITLISIQIFHNFPLLKKIFNRTFLLQGIPSFSELPFYNKLPESPRYYNFSSPIFSWAS